MRHCKILIKSRAHLSSQTMLPLNRRHSLLEFSAPSYSVTSILEPGISLRNERGHDGLESLQPVHGYIRACCDACGYNSYRIRSPQLGYYCARGFYLALHSCSTGYYRWSLSFTVLSSPEHIYFNLDNKFPHFAQWGTRDSLDMAEAVTYTLGEWGQQGAVWVVLVFGLLHCEGYLIPFSHLIWNLDTPAVFGISSDVSR